MRSRPAPPLLALALALVAGAPATAQPDPVPPPRGPWVPSWEVLRGGYEQVDDLAVAAPGEAWGVDFTRFAFEGRSRRQTAMVRLEDDLWRVTQVIEGAELGAIDLSRDGFGVAAGSDGAVFHLAGGAWRRAPAPTRVELQDVAVWSATDAWVCGDAATVARWDGRAWTITPVPVAAESIVSIAAVGPGEAWAVSYSGRVLHHAAGAWSEVAAPAIERPLEIAFADGDEGAIVGRGVLRYRDGAWARIGDDAARFGSIAWSGERWVATIDGRIARLEGDVWRPIELGSIGLDLSSLFWVLVRGGPAGLFALAPDGSTVDLAGAAPAWARPAARRLAALDVLDGDFGWAGGDAVTAGFVGTDGGRWTATQRLATGARVEDIDLLDAADGWAVGVLPRAGAPDEARMWRYDGTAWNPWPIDKTWVVRRLQMLSADDGWAAGPNVVLRWDGARWSLVGDVPPNDGIGDLAMWRGGDAPAGWLGTFGGVLRLADGAWSVVRLAGIGNRQVIAVDAPSERSAWAATTDELYRYDGTTWRDARLPKFARSVIHDVVAPGDDEAWVLVEPDGLFRWHRDGWERHDLAPIGAKSRPLRLRVLRLAPDSETTDVFLVGDRPVVARYRAIAPVAALYVPYGAR